MEVLNKPWFAVPLGVQNFRFLSLRRTLPCHFLCVCVCVLCSTRPALSCSCPPGQRGPWCVCVRIPFSDRWCFHSSHPAALRLIPSPLDCLCGVRKAFSNQTPLLWKELLLTQNDRIPTLNSKVEAALIWNL